MRTCHACQRELEALAVMSGKCPHCGAVLRKIAPRTISDTRVRDETGDADEASSVAGESHETGPTDSGADPGGATVELSNFFDLDEYMKNKPPSGEEPPVVEIELEVDDTSAEPEASAEELPSTSRPTPPVLPKLPTLADLSPKTPTIADRSDMTMEFSTTPGAGQLGDPPLPPKPTRRSTHSLESDKTIDLEMSPSEVRHLDSQWRATIDPDAKQGQTIRARETVTGFRSSLPVKSRFVREKLKNGGPPPKSLAEVPDYELLDIIGEGGMGVVYAAHQSSIARTVAVKMLKPSAKVRDEQRDKFISEAVVTGELDHPNIVPIYDLGANDQGALFYSMKRVKGTPWDKVLRKKKLDENLSILLRVADAVAFAHAGGVVHRDLKPENVMLGDFGEVLLMDWGLARITPEFAHADTVYQPDSLGGTPAYMAPEMAKGPVESINKTSDVYLLGAILYEIIGGIPPHSGRDVMHCLMAASQNRIDAIRYEGELKEIALKAMATRQEDRYHTVKEFQEAVRLFQSHSESLVLTAHANQNLHKARESNDYPLYARALYGFQESLTLWRENHRAKLLLTETQRDYSTCALEKGDLDLAASLLDPHEAEHAPLLERIERARAERNARQRRLKMAKRAVGVLVATVVVLVSAFSVFFRMERDKAVEARNEADVQRGIAVKQKNEADRQRGIAIEQKNEADVQRGLAVEQKNEADRQRGIAVEQKNEADMQRARAEAAKRAEEYESYVAQIGLANAKINDNAYDYARELLGTSKPELRNWEWGRLEHLCQLGAASYKAEGPVTNVAYSPDGKTIAAGDMKGKLTVRDAAKGTVRYQVPHGQYVLAVAYSPDGERLATGSSDKTIHILTATTGAVERTLRGHTDGVLCVRFSPDGQRLVSGSYDNTARVWDVGSGQELQTLKGHSWWVWAADFAPDGKRIVTAGQDGKAIVWGGSRETRDKSQEPEVRREAFSRDAERSAGFVPIHEFTGHNGAVYSARFSPDGKLVATGGYDKLVLVWNPSVARSVDIGRRLDGIADAEPNYTRLAGHGGPVRSVVFSPNGQLLLSGSEDNSLRVWDVAAAEGVKTLRGHGSMVRSCAFSPDGHWALSGGDDESVRLWNVQGYQEVRVLHATVFAGHEDAVLGARFSRDGRQIVTASRDRTASMWDAATGKPVRRFQEGHDFLVSSVAFFPDGRRLATGAGDNTVRLWDATAGTQLAVLPNTGPVGTLAASPDGRWLATGSMGFDVQLWNAADGTLGATLQGHSAEVSALRFSPDGKQLASGDSRGRIRVWSVGEGRESEEGRGTSVESRGPEAGRVFSHDAERSVGVSQESRVKSQEPNATLDPRPSLLNELTGHNGAITALRFSPEGGWLISASGDHTCAQWDLARGEENRARVLKHDDWVSSIDVSPDGKLAITTCEDGIARLWRLADATVVATMKSGGAPFNSANFSPEGSTAVLSSSVDKRVSLWSVSGVPAGVTEEFFDFSKLGGEVWAAMFAPGGQHVVTIGGNDAQLWEVGTHRPVMRYSPHGAVASAALSPDGKLVATGSWDHSAKIWDAATGHAIRKLVGGHLGYINAVEFSPDGRELLTASDDGTARLWDVATGKPTGVVFQGHKARILSATFSPDGSQVLTTSGDKTARLWDRASGKPSGAVLAGHDWAVLCGALSADGRRIVTGSQDKSAIVWDAATGTKQAVLAGHTAAIASAAFSPDGSRIVTGSQDNSAKLWDAATGKEILSLPGHTQEVTSVSFSPDGLNVLTASRDGTAIIWQAREWRGKAEGVSGAE
ncbi:MAG: protein kinase [Pirellulales bacterium]|nr:protein kinase [Pirellulales bacterium]